MKTNYNPKILRGSQFGGRQYLAAFAVIVSLLWNVSSVHGSTELDRQFRLQKIGVLRPWDNVDGLFSDLVSESIISSLQKESRFIVTDLRRTSQVLSLSKLSYLKLIEEKEILVQVAKKQGLDVLIRSKVVKEGPIYRFQLDGVFGRTAQVLATEQFQVKDPFLTEAITEPTESMADKTLNANAINGSDSFKSALSTAMIRLLAQIPFKGMVTGRDGSSITVDIGSRSNIGKGDRLVVGTLEELKEHPLLKKIVDWRFTTTGKVVVTEVDDGMAFGRIDSEETGRPVARFQKILQVIPAPEESPDLKILKTDEESRKASLREAPTLGYFAPGLFIGNYSREASSGTAAQSFSGSAFSFGALGDAQIWLTSRWFTEASFGFSTGGYKQKNISTQAESFSSSVTARMSRFRIGFGYFFPFSEEFFGPRAFLRTSYESLSFSLPKDNAGRTSTTKVSGILFGLGGDLPFRDAYGMALSLDFGPFSGGSEAGAYYGTNSGASAAELRISGYQWLQPKLKLQLNLDFKSASIDFVNGATISNKFLSVGPSLLFYF